MIREWVVSVEGVALAAVPRKEAMRACGKMPGTLQTNGRGVQEGVVRKLQNFHSHRIPGTGRVRDTEGR